MPHYMLLIHGIGMQKQNALSLSVLQQRIEQAFEKKFPGRPDELVIHQAFWAGVIQRDEDLLEQMIQKTGLRGFLRRFIISFLGDAVAYSKLPPPRDPSDAPYTYDQIQEVFAKTLEELNILAAGHPGSPLTVVAHSLGSVIASDGIYDLMNSNRFPANLILENLFTLGSPLALYGLRYGLEKFDKPIRPKLWQNFFYRTDLIGFPLKVLNREYDQAVQADIRLSPLRSATIVVGLFRAVVARIPILGNLLSHTWYFSDRRVVGAIVKALAVP